MCATLLNYTATSKMRSKILCVDLETTSCKIGAAEILRCSIQDGNGKSLFCEYFKPIDTVKWSDAEKANGISTEQVASCVSFLAESEKVQRIIDKGDIIVTYCGARFDIPILENYGISFANKMHYDVAEHFARYNGEILEGNDVRIRYRYKKLDYCGQMLGFPYEKLAELQNNALFSTEVTLYCFYRMLAIEQGNKKGGSKHEHDSCVCYC